LTVKVFITGATGFVGNHLRELLLSPQYQVFAASFPEKPEEEKAASGEKIFFLDIRSEKDVHDIVKDIKPDWIFHLAAISNVKHSWEERKVTLETNLMGTFYLLEAVRRFTPDARVLFVSSSDVYGALVPEEKVWREEDALRAVNPYAFTKISGEMLSEFYFLIEKMKVIIARSFPHTGPGQSPDFVCSDWAFQIARIEKDLQEPAIRVGNCSVRRDFCDVRDVVRAYILLLQKGRSGQVYNISSGKAIRLQEILDLLLSLARRNIAVDVDERKLRKVDIPFLVGDNKKIRKEVAWQPKIPLPQTLGDLLNDWRQKVSGVRPS
jgi:GDP-4-dehydro-6-deoxy-D-mannose reductase